MKWKIAGELPGIEKKIRSLGVAGPVCGINNDVLLVGGGANFPDNMPWLGGKKKYYQFVNAFKIVDDSLTLIAKKLKLPEPIAYPASTSTSKGLVYMGGENENGISNRVLLLKWDGENDSLITEPLPHLPIPLTNAAAVTYKNHIYLTGGDSPDSTSNQLMQLDLDHVEKGWTTLAPLPQPAAYGLLLMGQCLDKDFLFYIGGRKRQISGISQLNKEVFAYDPVTNKWSKNKSLPYPLSAGTGVQINEHTLAIFGGDKGEWFHKTEVLIQKINSEADPVKKAALNQEKIMLQSTHPGFSNEVLLYDTDRDEWMKSGIIPYPLPATTTAVLNGKNIFIPSGEVKAGVRSPQILVGILQ